MRKKGQSRVSSLNNSLMPTENCLIPRFNKRNELLVRKHVHSAVLTALYGLTWEKSPLRKEDRVERIEILRR